jgi:uroporphyrinogen-III decarboxylase
VSLVAVTERLEEVVLPQRRPAAEFYSSSLAIGTPDDVYQYSEKLIQGIGPDGFILGQGCDIPFNAKVDNVKAMVSAATGK